MKKYLLLLAAGLLLTTPNVFAEDENEETPPPPPPPPLVNIPLNPPYPSGGEIQHPRSLAPISGVYTGGVVELYFAVDVGLVSVTVANTTTGEMWFETADSSDGVVTTAIAPSVGSYLVTIETQTAGTFVGEFVL